MVGLLHQVEMDFDKGATHSVRSAVTSVMSYPLIPKTKVGDYEDWEWILLVHPIRFTC